MITFNAIIYLIYTLYIRVDNMWVKSYARKFNKHENERNIL